MYDPLFDDKDSVKTTDIIVDLVKESYILCDKTGTLTINVISFRICLIG